MSMKVEEGGDINKHILEMSETGTKLRRIRPDGTISINDLLISALLVSLPTSFDVITSRCENLPDVTFKMVQNAVREELVKRKKKAAGTAGASANAAQHQRSYPSAVASGSTLRPKCLNCNESHPQPHWRCPKRREEDRKKREEKERKQEVEKDELNKKLKALTD